jgi:hypothetical protein
MQRERATRELLVRGSRPPSGSIARELHDVIGTSSLRAVAQPGGREPRAPALLIWRGRTPSRKGAGPDAHDARRRSRPSSAAFARTRPRTSPRRCAPSWPDPFAPHPLSVPIACRRWTVRAPWPCCAAPQECVTNAIRHASAQNLWIELDLKAAASTCGYATTEKARRISPRQRHLRMRERIAALSGRLRLNPGPPGFEAEVWVP